MTLIKYEKVKDFISYEIYEKACKESRAGSYERYVNILDSMLEQLDGALHIIENECDSIDDVLSLEYYIRSLLVNCNIVLGDLACKKLITMLRMSRYSYVLDGCEQLKKVLRVL